MNQKRRIKLNEARHFLSKALSIVSDVKEEEQDAIDNFPENLQNSDRYFDMENAIDWLEEAIANIEHADESINNAL